jgi:hypothetical protein
VGSGRVLTCVGLVAMLAVLFTATTSDAQPVRRVSGLTDAFGSPSTSTDGTMPTRSPIPPRTAYQPTLPNQREPDFPLPGGAAIDVPQASKAKIFFQGSRYGTAFNAEGGPPGPDGTRRILITGGIIINVTSLDGLEQTEFATDEAVAWIRDPDGKGSLDGLVIDGDGKKKVEIYMSGNVIIRTARGRGAKIFMNTVRAAEVYYDTNENKAIAIRADLEMSIPNVPDAFHLTGDEVHRLDLENWEVIKGSANASKLPSDPGLRLDSSRFTLSERRVVRRNIFGIPFRDVRTGEQVEYVEQIVTGRNVVTRLAGVPVFYLPRLRLDAADPFGPLESLSFSQSRQFGQQYSSTWDIYELLALRPPPGHSWRLNLDYLTKRGPAGGTDYTYRIPGETPADPSPGSGLIRLYGISDNGFDLLGGYRGPTPMPPELRGRAMWRHQQEILEGLNFQGQVALLSDQNFLEQYYKNEFDLGPNQETFAYLTWSRRNFGASVLVEDRVGRNWITETNWLPRVDGHLTGQTFLNDLFVYSARGSAAYAQLRPSEYNPFPLLSTDKRTDTGRFDIWQELSVPLSLGPVKFAPYGILQLSEYTNDLNGNEIGRVYGGGGARASLPFSRLYGDVGSELLNLRGLYHKVIFGANYRYARTNVPFNQLPQLDRLNDDAVDQAWRNITIFQTALAPGPTGLALQNSAGYSVFNPQLYAIRRVVENRIDTLDDINVVQMDVRQRFQTKRGYPGMEHTVDFLSFDVSASYFPEANRDNIGHPFAFLEYASIWNVGDRTAVVSNGWFEPYENGSRYWNAGVYLNRTDRTNFYLGYRQTDPLNSKAVTASVGYQLSHRYYATIGASYDFGLQAALSNSLMLTRTGTDLTVSLGFTYTAFVNSFGFQFLVIPNVATTTASRLAGSGLNSQTMGGTRR